MTSNSFIRKICPKETILEDDDNVEEDTDIYPDGPIEGFDGMSTFAESVVECAKETAGYINLKDEVGHDAISAMWAAKKIEKFADVLGSLYITHIMNIQDLKKRMEFLLELQKFIQDEMIKTNKMMKKEQMKMKHTE